MKEAHKNLIKQRLGYIRTVLDEALDELITLESSTATKSLKESLIGLVDNDIQLILGLIEIDP